MSAAKMLLMMTLLKTEGNEWYSTVQRRKWSPTANHPQTANDPEPQMISDVDRKWSPPENNEWHGFCFLNFFNTTYNSFLGAVKYSQTIAVDWVEF